MTEPAKDAMTKDEAVRVLQYLAGPRAMTDLDGEETIALRLVLSLMESHRLVPVETAEQCLRVAELLSDEGVVAAGPISPAFREDFRKLTAALKGDA